MDLTAKEKRAFILQSREKMPTTIKIDKYSKKIEQRILNLLANFKKKK